MNLTFNYFVNYHAAIGVTYKAFLLTRILKELSDYILSLLSSCMHLTVNIILQVGPTYGRKTMTGLLRSQGILAGEKQIGHALAQVQPDYHLRRLTRTECETNPHPYFSEYFGHKLHIDQNEKLVMFGVTHVAAIDGYSKKVVGFVSMPVKNNVEIYTHLFRYVLYTIQVFQSFSHIV